jgi:hypothetical protein
MLLKNIFQRLAVSSVLRRRWHRQRPADDGDPVDWWSAVVGAFMVYVVIATVRACV